MHSLKTFGPTIGTLIALLIVVILFRMSDVGMHFNQYLDNYLNNLTKF